MTKEEANLKVEKKMKETYTIVKNILTDHPATRESDCLLYAYVLNKKGYSCDISYREVMALNDTKLVPGYESVSRARRKVQENCPELAPSEESKVARKQLQKAMKKYIKKV